MKLLAKLGAGAAGLLGVASAASAAVIDTTEITGVISDAGTAVATIGVAVLGVYFGAKVYKWIKAAA